MEQKIVEINKKFVFYDPENPRSKTEFKEEDIESLKDSIEQDGQLEPATLEEVSNNNYVVVEGHRRLAAIQKSNKVNTIRAVVERNLSKEDRLLKQILIDNHRKNFTTMDRDKSWKKLWLMGKYDLDSFAKKISVSKSMVDNFVDRMNLGEEFLGKMKNISTSNIDETKSIKDVKLRKKVLTYADKQGLTRKDVRKLASVSQKVSEEVLDDLTKGKISIDDADNMKGLNHKDQMTHLATTKALNGHKKKLKSMISKGSITEGREMTVTYNKVNEFQKRFFKLSADLMEMNYALDEFSNKEVELNEPMKKILKGCVKELKDKAIPTLKKIETKLGGI